MKRKNRARLAAILGLTILYVILFKPLTAVLGPAVSPLIVIPVFMTGSFFGVGWGLFAGFASVVLNGIIYATFLKEGLVIWLGISWVGNIMTILTGYIGGRLKQASDTYVQARAQLGSNGRYFSLINSMIYDLLTQKQPDDIYYYLTSHLTNLLVADHGYLIHWEAVKEQAVLITATAQPWAPVASVILDEGEASIVLRLLESRHAQVIVDESNLPHIFDPSVLRAPDAQTRSAIGIPIVVGEYKFGAALLVFDGPHWFSDEETRQAELAGNQIALALWNIEQETKIRKQLKEANALANIEQVLSETERIGIETVLQLIVDSARELIPAAEQVVLHLLDEDRQVLIPRGIAGLARRRTQTMSMRLGEGVAGQVAATKKAIVIQDVQTDHRFLSKSAPARFRSLISAPVQSNDQCVGTISIQSDHPYAFTAEDGHLLDALGVQAAIAIGNANLLETTRQDLAEINALYHISQGLVSSLDPEELMVDVAQLLEKEIGFYNVQIYASDIESGNLVLRQGSGAIGTQLKEQGYQLRIGDGIVGHVAETGESFFTNDVDRVIFFIRNPLLPDTQSELAVPIKVGNEVLGVLDIQQSPPGRITGRHAKLVEAVADQLAVALQKASLYTDLQTALDQEQAMRSQLMQSERLALVGRLLASVSHELNNPLQAIQNALFLLKEEADLTSQSHEDLQIILSETERMAALIERLRTTYRPIHAEEFHLLELNSIIEEVYTLISTHMRHNKISFEFHPDPNLPAIPGLSDQLRQVLLNLLLNAAEAMIDGGRLIVETRNAPDENAVVMIVQDSGPGIDPKILPQIFDPFVTDKATGTGLGLTITHDIIEQHKGRIKAENLPQGGAVFTVWLPSQKKDDL